MSGVERSTCCRHCAAGCRGVSGVWEHAAQEQPTGNAPIAAYAVWGDDDCPMCAEAERIADAIEDELQTLTPSDDEDYQHGIIVGVESAHRIARGEA